MGAFRPQFSDPPTSLFDSFWTIPWTMNPAAHYTSFEVEAFKMSSNSKLVVMMVLEDSDEIGIN